MTNGHHSSDILGQTFAYIFGCCGYWLSKLFSLKFILSIPKISEDVHALIIALLCGVAGWAAHRLLNYFFPNWLIRKEEKKNTVENGPHAPIPKSRSNGK